MDDYEEAILFTYALLESRLDRLEYILSAGKYTPQDRQQQTLPQRIQKIERSLNELSERASLLSDVKQLIADHSDLLPKPAKTEREDSNPLTPFQKSVIVVERAPNSASTASQLKSLEDQHIPQTDGFTKLAKLRPRIAEAENRHLQQALQIALLRRQSGLLNFRVKQIQLVGAARCWAEWHKRCMDTQRTIIRAEFKLKPEDEEEKAEEIEEEEEEEEL